MKNDNKTTSKRMVRIIVPIALVCIIAGIWLVKNGESLGVWISKTFADSSQQENTGADEDLGLAGCSVSPPEETPEGESNQISEEDALMTVENGLDLEQLKAYGVPIVLKFGAEWCGPCQAFAPILEEVHAENAGRVIIKDIDIDRYPDIAKRFPVRVVPTMVLIDAEGAPYVSDGSAEIFNYYNSKETGEHMYTTLEGVISKDRMVALLGQMGMQP